MNLETFDQHRRTGDPFFEVKWASWLADTIPGVTKVILIEGARLFFPEERSAALAGHLRSHWDHVGTRP
jgi:hypothetical protein